MAELSQDSRLARITTPLGQDTFIVIAVDGEEAISDLFHYHVQLMSHNHEVKHSELLGKSVTLSIFASGEENQRYINGYVNSFRLLDVNDEGLRLYDISIVPGLWFANLNSKNQIFQHKSAKDIVTDILNQHSTFIDFSFSTNVTFMNREYCVQFEESDYDFISRLLAEEGISYYFEHKDSEHKLVLTDNAQGYIDLNTGALDYDGGGSQPTQNSIHRWHRNYNYHSGAAELTDYNEFSPTNIHKVNVKTSSSLNSANGLVRRHFGLYHFEAEGDSKHAYKSDVNKRRATSIIAAHEERFDQAVGTSDVGLLAAGGKFEIEHPISSESGKYTISRLTMSLREGNGQDTFFENEFECIPSDITIRPVWHKPLKKIDYPQVAKVEEVKATESESSQDVYTQLKVKFPWDGEQTSCWVRVAQAFAGKNWGANFVPRLGQEVIINYINGDLCRPIVTGAVYNAANEGPNYTATQSGWKTLYDASAFNELRFDDKPGEEEVYMEAGKDHNWVVHNDQAGLVENNQTLEVKQDRTITVAEGNEAITVSKGDRTVDVDTGDYTTTVAKGNHVTKVNTGDQTDTVSKGDKTTTVSMGDHLTKVSQGDHKLSVSMGDRKVDLALGDHTVKCNAGKYSVNAMGGVQIESLAGIELKCGASSIKMTPAGITIKGIMLTCQGEAMAEVKAGAMLTLKGAITMIN